MTLENTNNPVVELNSILKKNSELEAMIIKLSVEMKTKINSMEKLVPIDNYNSKERIEKIEIEINNWTKGIEERFDVLYL